MNDWNSGIYSGKVTHKRLRPKRHFLQYRMFYMLIDIDEIDALARRYRLFSRNRFNIFSFFDSDHGKKSEEETAALRDYIESHLREAGAKTDGGVILLMTMPRIFGYVFNPLSVYFCHDRAGNLNGLIYEVSNTFGQRHSYIFPLDESARKSGPLNQECAKEFYVSPFMDMELGYDFTICPPGETASVVINAQDKEGLVLATAFTGGRREFSDRHLLGLAFSYPLLTLKVILGIHWEALQIWLKGVGIRPRPPTPRQSRTIITRHAKREAPSSS